MGSVRESLRRFIDAFGGRHVVVHEDATHPDPRYDTDNHLLGGAGADMVRAAKVSHYLVKANPMGRRIINIDVDYVVGAQLPISPKLPEDGSAARAEEIDAEITLWRGAYHLDAAWFQMLWKRYLIEGEIGVLMVDGDSGPRPVIISTQEMSQATDTLTKDVVALIHTKDGKDHRYRVINSMTDDEENKTYAGELLYFRHDATEGLRGSPELLPIINRLIWEDETNSLGVRRYKALSRWFWQVSVKDGTTDEIDDLNDKYATAPKTASTRYTNDRVDFKAVTPELQTGDMEIFSQNLRNTIAGGAGQPGHWHGDGGDVNLATATAMTRPTLKQMSRFQGEFRGMVIELLDYTAAALAEGSRIGAQAVEGLKWDITLPDLSVDDWGEMSEAMAKGVLAVDSMVGGGYITHTAGQRILREVTQNVMDIEITQDELPEEPTHGADPE